MWDTLFGTSTETVLTVPGALITILVAVIIGLLISFTYMKTYLHGQHSQSFALTLIMIPAIIAIIILLVGSNVARAFSLAGAFSIIRFRSAPGDPKDITYIFFALAAGLACGVGLYFYAALFAVILCALMFLLSAVRFGRRKTEARLLKITIPEDLNYAGAFDAIFEKFTKSAQLIKVRTTDMGTLYELEYNVALRKDASEKDFMDLLRCRNGNLNIVLSLAGERSEF